MGSEFFNKKSPTTTPHHCFFLIKGTLIWAVRNRSCHPTEFVPLSCHNTFSTLLSKSVHVWHSFSFKVSRPQSGFDVLWFRLRRVGQRNYRLSYTTRQQAARYVLCRKMFWQILPWIQGSLYPVSLHTQRLFR